MTENQFDTIIEPQSGWISVNFREIWKYRELVYILAWRDVKIRYKQTVLGAAWAIFQPFVSMIVFSVFFGTLVKVPSDNLPYPIFVYAGLLPWTFFANSLTGASNSLIGQANLISKVYFPRLIIPLSSLGSCILDFAIALLIMFAMMLYYGFSPNISLSIFPFLFVATIATALGVGTLFSALSVAYRDVKYMLPFLVQLWMYATPVIYPLSIIPERWRWVLSFNPMAGLIDGYRSAFLGKPFDQVNVEISMGVSILLLIVGLYYFRKVERRFADII
jgi:lipopolysaccharide transport system permease protein